MLKPGRGGANKAPSVLNRILFATAIGGACFFVGYGARFLHESSSALPVAGRGSVALAASHALADGMFARGEGLVAADMAPPVRELDAVTEPSVAPPAPSPAEQALQHLLDEPMEGCPAKWLESLNDYARWHAEQRELLRQRAPGVAKVIVYSCAETVDATTVVGDDCGGFADRLVGVSHLFIFAMLHRWVFFVDWSSGGSQLPPSVFHSPYINYTFDEGLVLAPGRTVELRERHFNGCPDHQGPCVLQRPDAASLFDKDVTLTRINKGPVRYSTDEARARIFGELGLHPDNVGGCIIRALVQPNPETVEAFREWAVRLLDPAVHVISLHVRTGDKSMHLLQPPPDGYGPDDKYWACVLKLHTEATQRIESLASAGGDASLTAPGRAVVFVSADDVRYKAAGVQRYGNRTVWATHVRPWHISKLQLWWDGFIHRKDTFPNPVERLRDTFGEWWLLSMGDDFVMPGFSGYSRTAFAYSQKPFGRNLENYEGRGLCCCDKPLGQKDLAYLGGGY